MLTIIVTNALFLVSVIRTFMTIGKQCELIWTQKDSRMSIWFWNPYVLLMTNISHLLFISILCYLLENKWNLCSSLKNDICVNLRLCYKGTQDRLESMIWMQRFTISMQPTQEHELFYFVKRMIMIWYNKKCSVFY